MGTSVWLFPALVVAAAVGAFLAGLVWDKVRTRRRRTPTLLSSGAGEETAKRRLDYYTHVQDSSNM